MIRKRSYIEILKGIAFGIGILGFTSGIILESYPFGKTFSIIYVLVLTIFYFSTVLLGERALKTSFRVERDSPEETKIFRDWYSQPGELRIFCTDLKWISRKNEIINVLMDKEDNLHLYLRNYKNKTVNKLFKSEATVYHVKKEVKSHHRFSILNDDGFMSIIIRNKRDEKTDLIEFDNFRNHPPLYNLADDMLDDCFDEVFHISTHEKLY